MTEISNLATGVSTPDEETRARTLRIELQAVIDAEGLAVKAVSEQADIGYSTLAAWLKGNYAGRTDTVNTKVSSWISAHKARKKVTAAAPQALEYLDIPSASAFRSVMEYSQATPDMGLITGGAGVGKTYAAEEHQRRNPNVWILTADPSMQTPNAVLRELCDVIGVECGAQQRRLAAIVRRVTGTRGLVIVDEAQHLTTQAIDQLRTIHDKARIGVVFIGNEPLRRRIEGMGRDTSHAMIFSRIGMRKRRDRSQVKDVAMVLDACGLSDQEIRDRCRFIAMQPGALRQMTKTLNYARVLARSSDRDEVSMRDLGDAWKELTSGELPAVGG
ncbi:AAA family ATPase [Acetobacter sp. DsW_063]|uniref:AAA family ATPase n=1 Tax=Acetobacter sp. DsW_063 TaxID=1514894 RepID=UPI000A376F9F|nr:AAA family ATPase [Acetobacter sp. DsW_063]OUJ17086.1 hypothetical protein HK28_07915 [Acetobacter sp. DsW_063]